MKLPTILTDDAVKAAGSDLLSFDRYLEPLVSIFVDSKTETPLTVGIFGAWGTGKSSLLSLLDETLRVEHPRSFVRVWFNPWIHRREENLLVPLLHALHDTLESDPLERFAESAKKISNVLIRLGADVILKSLTADTVSLERMESLEQAYFKERGRIESEIRRLHNILQAEIESIAQAGAKLVLFIDDLDRCDPGQIIDLLETVKLFFSLKHVFVLLAVDKEIIDRGIEIKYSQFHFAENRAEAIGAEYLEKMIQLPLQLFPLHKTQVVDFMGVLDPSVPATRLALLQEIVEPNPRKIKRILNILAFTSAVIERSPGLDALDSDVVARLIVMQVQRADLYFEITRNPKLVGALEKVFAGALRVQETDDFIEYGEQKESLQKLCQRFYIPAGFLQNLFKDSPFSRAGDLQPYLSMLGG